MAHAGEQLVCCRQGAGQEVILDSLQTLDDSRMAGYGFLERSAHTQRQRTAFTEQNYALNVKVCNDTRSGHTAKQKHGGL